VAIDELPPHAASDLLNVISCFSDRGIRERWWFQAATSTTS